MQLFYKSISRSGSDRLAWRLSADRLRILCYHGVCEDRVAGEPWVPHSFVTRSAFEAQLRYLRAKAAVLPLAEAVHRLQNGALPPRSVALTFDDGYANNLHLACPLLEQYQVPATFFLSSSYMETGELFPFIKLQLLRLKLGAEAHGLPDYKSMPMDLVARETELWWQRAQPRLDQDQRRTVRPLTVEEVRRMTGPLFDFGAHTHTHCILSHETAERRKWEIRLSISKVAAWSGRPARVFSYPNGCAGDFGEADKAELRAQGIAIAVAGIGGANRSGCDLLELRRYPIALFHDADGFRVEVSGFRTAVLRARERLHL